MINKCALYLSDVITKSNCSFLLSLNSVVTQNKLTIDKITTPGRICTNLPKYKVAFASENSLKKLNILFFPLKMKEKV